jgi:methylenetetrahydrofolate dehydrogenase (NADP+)/methenyltetrahydrofolate cyclohydrolase
MENIINGREVSKSVRIALASEIEQYQKRPKLAVSIVGDNSSAMAYVKGIMKMAKLAKVEIELNTYDQTITELDYLNEIKRYNEDDSINGVLVLMPLPNHISRDKVLKCLDPLKDVDGLTSANIGAFHNGEVAHVASTPKGVDTLIEKLGLDVKGMDAVVIGASNVVGKPMAELLLQREATVTVCHKETKSLAKYTKEADLVVACAGVAHLVKEDMVKDGVIIFDVGVNFVEGKMVGDCDFEAIKNKAKLITPVPGGVGPMTIATLFTQTYNSFKIMNNL